MRIGVLVVAMIVTSIALSSSASALFGYDYYGKIDLSDACIWASTGCGVAGGIVLLDDLSIIGVADDIPIGTIVGLICIPTEGVCAADAIIERYTDICGDVKLKVFMKKWWNPGPPIVEWPSC